jgi:hypothetical protein
MEIKKTLSEDCGKELATNVHWPFIMLCCAPLLGLRVWMACSKQNLYDFITYWSSGHLFLTGGHPYSESAILTTEQMQGWPSHQPIVLLCPPWSLPFVAIAAWWPFRTAQLGWFWITILLDCASAVGLWKYFGGDWRRSWIGLLVCATFVPMGGAELLGQINPLMLASITALLLLLKSERYFLAGLVLLGCGLKPHLFYLVFLALLFWIVNRRAWMMLAGALVSFGAATALAQIYNPASADYLHPSVNAALATPCGLGWALRSVFGMQQRWLQFLPSISGFTWFLWYWSKNWRNWDWRTHSPLLILVSVSTAPYFWFHDFILIFPALIAVSARGAYRSFFVLIAYLVLQLVIFCAGLSPSWMAVFSVFWIAVYGVAQFENTNSEAPRVLTQGSTELQFEGK